MTENQHSSVVIVIDQSIKLARTVEALSGVLTHLLPAVQILTRISEWEQGEPGPEIRAAMNSLGEAADAVERAIRFVDARFDAARDRMMEEHGDA